MFFVRTHQEVVNVRRAIERIGKLSDNIVGVGPFGIGIDGILTWVPVVGDLYSLSAGGMLLMMGVRAHAPLHVLLQAASLIGVRTAIGAAAIPILGPLYPAAGAAVDLFRGHKMSAELLVKTIDSTLYVEGGRRDLQSDPVLAADVAQARAEGDRVVFLG
jgi:hypothetical protein